VFPQPGADAPVFVFIHGGYWRAMSKEDSAFTAPMLHEAGAVVVTLDYALAPAVTLTRIVAQVRRAMGWIQREIAGYGGDPGRVVVGGSSAGGHLTGMVLADGWRERYGVPAPGVIGGLTLSGLFDVRPLIRTHVNAWMKLDESAAAANSPMLHLPAAPAVPLVACHGANETTEFGLQTRRFADAWANAGGPARYESVPDRDHFSVVVDLQRADSFVGEAALELLGLR
jgi:arylformamidase